MLQFDGAIAGMGTASGTRLVVGMWPLSPYGSVTDVMVERPDGHRILLAPTQGFADFVAATYEFDEVRVTPVLRLRVDPGGALAGQAALPHLRVAPLLARINFHSAYEIVHSRHTSHISRVLE